MKEKENEITYPHMLLNCNGTFMIYEKKNKKVSFDSNIDLREYLKETNPEIVVSLDTGEFTIKSIEELMKNNGKGNNL